MSEEEDGGTTIRPRDEQPKPVPAGKQESGKKRDGVYIVIILLLLMGGGYMGWVLSDKNKAINDCGLERDSLYVEMDNLNQMMYDQGLEDGENLKQNLENMLSMYDQMKGENQDMNDSIAAQKNRINELMMELEDAKNDKNRYASTVYSLRKEAETLRSIMKDYIRTIDSLNVANGILTESLAETMNNLEATQNTLTTVEEERDQLNDKVNKGSKLTAFGFVSEGIKERGSGSYKETNRAKACTHIRSCFSLGENSIAPKGDRTVFMRVITPGGTVLTTSNTNTFSADGGQTLVYSDKKTVNYQNQQVDVCIYHELSVELEKGNYTTQIYCDGVKIGTDTFVLK